MATWSVIICDRKSEHTYYQVPGTGIEPATTRLKVQRSADWANRAHKCYCQPVCVTKMGPSLSESHLWYLVGISQPISTRSTSTASIVISASTVNVCLSCLQHAHDTLWGAYTSHSIKSLLMRKHVISSDSSNKGPKSLRIKSCMIDKSLHKIDAHAIETTNGMCDGYINQDIWYVVVRFSKFKTSASLWL